MAKARDDLRKKRGATATSDVNAPHLAVQELLVEIVKQRRKAGRREQLDELLDHIVSSLVPIAVPPKAAKQPFFLTGLRWYITFIRIEAKAERSNEKLNPNAVDTRKLIQLTAYITDTLYRLRRTHPEVVPLYGEITSRIVRNASKHHSMRRITPKYTLHVIELLNYIEDEVDRLKKIAARRPRK